jgi:hypothetical protein
VVEIPPFPVAVGQENIFIMLILKAPNDGIREFRMANLFFSKFFESRLLHLP